MADLEIHDIPQQLKAGIKLVEHGALDKGRGHFEAYLQNHPDSALALSYVGMLRAVKAGMAAEGLDMCREATRLDPGQALCFLNLSRVYLTLGDRYQCVRALHKGLKLRSPYRDYLMGFYGTIGRRRNPPLRFLSRNHPINNLLGKLSWKLGLK